MYLSGHFCFLKISEKIKGKLTVNEKLMILNVFKGLEHDHPQFNKTVLLSKCCEYTGNISFILYINEDQQKYLFNRSFCANS
jgi:hypothetical protein